MKNYSLNLSKVALIVFNFIICLPLSGQISFTDPEFKKLLLNLKCVNNDNDAALDSCDLNKDLEISVEEAQKVTRLEIFSDKIINLSDLVHFPNLKIINSITTKGFKNVDLSQCKLIEQVNLAYDEDVLIENFVHLKKCYLTITNNVNKLKIIKNDSLELISANSIGFNTEITNLEYVDFSQNALKQVVLSFSWKKKIFKEFDCSNNKLTSISYTSTSNDFDIINFSNNKLSNSSFPFSSLPSGKITDLRNNNLTNVTISNDSISDIILANNPLKKLSISGKLSQNHVLNQIDLAQFDLESLAIGLEGEIDRIVLNNPLKLTSLTLVNVNIKDELIIDYNNLLQDVYIDFKSNVKFRNINEALPNGFTISAKNVAFEYISKTAKNFPVVNALDSISIQNSPQLTTVVITSISACKNLVIRNNTNLGSINLKSSYARVISVINCESLASLNIEDSYDFLFIQKNLPKLATIKTTYLSGSLFDLPSLKEVDMSGRITSSVYFYNLISLETLVIKGETLGDLGLDNLPKLKTITIGNFNTGFGASCYSYKAKPNLVMKNLPSLQNLKIGNYCTKSLFIANLPKLDSLTLFRMDFDYQDYIQIINLPKLIYFSNESMRADQFVMRDINSLKYVYLNGIQAKSAFVLEKMDSIESMELNGIIARSGFKVSGLPQLRNLTFHNIYLEDYLTFNDLPSLKKLSVNFYAGQSRKVKSSFFGLPLLKNLTLKGDAVVIDTLDFSNCPKLDSIYLDLAGPIKMLSLKNNNEDLVYLNKESYFGKLNTICVDSEKEMAFIKSLLHSQSVAKFTYDCDLEVRSSLVSGNVLLMEDDGSIVPLNNIFIQIKVTDGDETKITSDKFGTFSFETSTLNKDIKIEALPDLNYFEIVNNVKVLNFQKHGLFDKNDLILRRKPIELNNVAVYYFPLIAAIPGFECTYNVLITNFSNKPADVDLVIQYKNDLIQYVGGSVDLSPINANLIVLKNLHLAPNEFITKSLTFKLNKPTDPVPLNGNDILDFDVKLLSLKGDVSPFNNVAHLGQIVRNSFDPNNLICLQGENVNSNDLINEVYYQINFENKGNGDAINVSISNALDTSFLDIKSLQILNSSHNVYAKINDSVIEFLFDNINLSYQVGNNMGYILYTIKPKKLLQAGDTIYNSASIYFDFNLPIETNVHRLALLQTSNTNSHVEPNCLVYPNPTNGILNLTCDLEDYLKVYIFNLDGNPIKFSKYSNSIFLDFDVPNGIYMLLVSDGTKILETSRFILSRY